MKTVDAILLAENALSKGVFPLKLDMDNDISITSYGLTKRELFAAMAMQGLLADPNVNDLDAAALSAVTCADKLLKILNQEEE